MQISHIGGSGRMLLIGALMLCAGQAHAQRSMARIAVAGGVATDQRGVQSNALTLAPSISLQASDRAAIRFDGSATRFAELWSWGGGGLFSGRDPLGRFGALTLDASVAASRLQGTTAASFLQADVTPALELRLRKLVIFGGAHAAAGSSSQEMQEPGLPIGGGRFTKTNSSARGVGPVVGAAVTMAGEAGTTVRIGVREERLRLGDIGITDRAISMSLDGNRAALTGVAGRRNATDERLSYGSAALSLLVNTVASLDISAGRYASNRVLGTPGGTYASAGVSVRLGRTSGVALAAPSDARAVRRGLTRLALSAPDAHRVEVAGDFNEWTLVPATRAANGVWYADMKILPGQYRYAFRVNGIDWRVPDGATAVDDGFGGKSAWLTIDAR